MEGSTLSILLKNEQNRTKPINLPLKNFWDSKNYDTCHIHRTQNEMTNSLLPLLGILSILFLLIWKWAYLKYKFSLTFMVSIEIPCCNNSLTTTEATQDYSFELLRFITQLITTKESIIPTLTVETRYGDSKIKENIDDDDLKDYKFRLYWLLGFYHTHQFWWKGTPFFINRLEEHITISAFKWHNNKLKELMEEVFETFKKTNNYNHTSLLYLDDGSKWSYLGYSSRKRALDTVILKEGIKEKLLDDFKLFLGSRNWYREMGIPYKRGYLLHGPPGTGKTSIIRAIAGHFDYGICQLSISNEDLNDDKLVKAVNAMPRKNILLFEDFESAFKKDENGETITSGKSNITKKALLNIFDGIATPEGLIMFITTNHVDKLDPALIRPGRVDVQLEINHPNNAQIKEMFGRFFPKEKENTELIKKLTDAVRKIDKSISMANVQNLFVLYRDDPIKAVENAEQYFEECCKNMDSEYINFYT